MRSGDRAVCTGSVKDGHAAVLEVFEGFGRPAEQRFAARLRAWPEILGNKPPGAPPTADPAGTTSTASMAG